MKEPKKPDDKAPVVMGVRYDELMARYANQVALRSTPEEIFLEFSSGVIPDPTTGQPLMPVHTRIAMTHAAARRLAEILTQTLSRPQPGMSQTPAAGFPALEK